MVSGESWAEQQKANTLLAGNDVINPEDNVRELLKISPTNKYIHAKQAQELVVLRTSAKKLGLPILNEIAEMVESHQLNVDGYSRAQYLDGLKWIEFILHKIKNKLAGGQQGNIV
ncbi:hypothetical protein LCGC14_2303620 [marine sediment metagenome]|uniref:Uncharacterized protein n=1 Tax=marine sediment metagenome TaxID=412755 RepID=A0A0F9F038_9ZZZZ